VHGYYLDVELLFAWLLRRGQRTRWTLHDCWAFTGHCAYFSAVGCEQWRGECGLESCPQLDTYPATISAASCHANFLRKRELFTSLPADRLTLIAPCRWLANLVGQSFLSKYPIEVRHNTVDTNIFKPSPSEFRQRHGLGDRFAVLGVASPWTERKGLDDFVRLAHDLDPQRFAIVLVGLSKKQRDRVAELAPGVVGLLRTDSPQELAQIYTACDVFFNPTREEVFCLVNLEAQACGTRVVSYDTGGCAEGLGPGNMAVAGYDEALTALMALCEWSHASNPVSGGGEQA
jgi:glycosyltransferase involved in cell wall biosynthesis